MRLLLCPLFALSAFGGSTAVAQGRIIDEGTFAITRAGSAQTENFRIIRIENGLIRATATVVSGPRRVQSTLTVDSLGTPLGYEVSVTEKGAPGLNIKAIANGGRLTATSNDQRGDESMREYPLSAGHTVLLEEGLIHQLFFAAIGKRPGTVQLIDLRGSRAGPATLTPMGAEALQIGGASVTATRYSLVSGAVRRDFWVDPSGRLLRVEIPSQQLVAAREELPR